MRIIDIHAHIYEKVAGITQGQPMSSTRLGRVTIGNQEVQFLPPSFEKSQSTAETLIAYMDWCGIEKALLMPNPYYGYHNSYFIKAVKTYPDRFRGVALVDILKGESAARELSAIYDEGSLFGFKIEVNSTFQCAPQKRMTDSDLAPVWDCCNQYHQPVFIHLFRNCDIEDLAVLVKRYRNTRFVICHMGADACFCQAAKTENFETVLSITRDNPNVFIDTSSVPVYYQEEYPFPSAIAIIEKAYKILGPEKMMWASDYPGMLNHATMRQLMNLVLNGCSKIPPDHQELIMGENAQHLFFDK
jgi:predicted TIM-barrel fold metal-dependent hydrolase